MRAFTPETLRVLAGREFPPEFAISPTFYPTLLATYKAIMPLVRFLNEPLYPEK